MTLHLQSNRWLPSLPNLSFPSLQPRSSELVKLCTGEEKPVTADVVRLVNELESAFDVRSSFDLKKLEGSWTLQYTCNPGKGTTGSVSAQGIAVSYKDPGKVTFQNIYLDQPQGPRLSNIIEDDNGFFSRIEVGGIVSIPDDQPWRANVEFTSCELTPKILGVPVRLSWLFDIIKKVRGDQPGTNWLDTTYIDDMCRIGRGNKGSIFVLTRSKST